MDLSAELTISPGAPASAEAFFQAGADLISLLDEVSEEPATWLVTDLRTASAVATVAAQEPTEQTTRTLRSVVGGLAAVEQTRQLPSDWSPDAAAAARRLVRAAGRRGSGRPGHLRLVSDESTTEVEFTAELAERLDQLQPFTRTMPGAVRGRLVGLNIAHGNRASLKPIEGRVVHLTFTDGLLAHLKEAMLDQVEVRGDVRQDVNGRIFHVKVEDVQPILAPEIAWTDLFGIYPEITGGRSIAEYLEESRGEAH